MVQDQKEPLPEDQEEKEAQRAGRPRHASTSTAFRAPAALTRQFASELNLSARYVANPSAGLPSAHGLDLLAHSLEAELQNFLEQGAVRLHQIHTGISAFLQRADNKGMIAAATGVTPQFTSMTIQMGHNVVPALYVQWSRGESNDGTGRIFRFTHPEYQVEIVVLAASFETGSLFGKLKLAVTVTGGAAALVLAAFASPLGADHYADWKADRTIERLVANAPCETGLGFTLSIDQLRNLAIAELDWKTLTRIPVRTR